MLLVLISFFITLLFLLHVLSVRLLSHNCSFYPWSYLEGEMGWVGAFDCMSKQTRQFSHCRGQGFWQIKIIPTYQFGTMNRAIYMYACKSQGPYSSVTWGALVIIIPHPPSLPTARPVNVKLLYEPQHDKTNKMAVCPAKTRIRLGRCPG